jgi:threonine dehydrogenase-like Zn-dependent dehydrogenase
MKAVCWQGKQKMSVEHVPDPRILAPHDCIVKITSTAICGSDLHLYNNWVAGMREGDILGHEFMGEVVEVGGEVKSLAVGDRVVVPFPIACGHCWYCKQGVVSACDNTNPNAHMLEAMYGFTGSGIFGYSHLYGGYAGGQAEYARVPFADVGPLKVPDDLSDEQVLFLSDILPTGYQAAERGDIKAGDVVAVWGAGPVGQFCIQSALLMGAERVIAIDRIPARLSMALGVSKATDVLNYEETDDLVELLKQMTGGRGPDVAIDAVGMEAHGTDLLALMDRAKQRIHLQMDRPNALRQVIQAVRKGGTVSIIGVYAGFEDKFPVGAIFAKGLTIRAGQCDVHKYLPRLLRHVQAGDFDPTGVITHRMSLGEADHAYQIFNEKTESCVKCVLKP